jgi:hypothetical protein
VRPHEVGFEHHTILAVYDASHLNVRLERLGMNQGDELADCFASRDHPVGAHEREHDIFG